MELQPGPLSPLDLGDFGLDVEPPTIAPIAAAFVTSLSPLHSALDAAYVTLAAEGALDLGDLGEGALSALSVPGAATTNDEAIASLNSASDTYAAAATLLNQLENFLPSKTEFLILPTLDGQPPGSPSKAPGLVHKL